MAYEYFYPGTKYTFDSPIYGSSIAYNPNIPSLSEFALTTDARTANQLQEISNKLNTGAKVLEISGSDPTLLDSIPKQQFKEINRQIKLTEAEITLHGPQVEASGYEREGWSEASRQKVERQIKSAMEKAHLLSPDKGIPVTFHSTSQLPEGTEIVKEDGKFVAKSSFIVDPETGKLVAHLKERKRYFPGEPETFDVEKEIERHSEESWRGSLRNLAFDVSRSSEAVEEINKILSMKGGKEAYQKMKEGALRADDLPEEERKLYQPLRRAIDFSEAFMREGYREMKEMFNIAYRSSEEASKSNNNELSNQAKDNLEKLQNLKKKIENDIKLVDKDPALLPKIMDEGMATLNSIKTPRLFKPLDEFVFDKSATTFGNTAFDSWEKFGNKAPIVSIENPPAGGGLSRAEDLKKLIEMSRKKFVEKAKEEGYSESEAKEAAKKMIGATWDVGHINMLRKFGYEKEDIIKETEKIAPFVKHVHLSDNFGMEHTELPMGMGNVPIKEIMEKLGKEGFKGKKVIEAFQWWQHMKTPPLVPTLEAFGSPLYPMIAQPNWAQAAATYGSYFQFPSAYLPEQHFSLYGGGFSSLPQELGGQIPGKQSRVTGTPME